MRVKCLWLALLLAAIAIAGCGSETPRCPTTLQRDWKAAAVHAADGAKTPKTRTAEQIDHCHYLDGLSLRQVRRRLGAPNQTFRDDSGATATWFTGIDSKRGASEVVELAVDVDQDDHVVEVRVDRSTGD